MVFRRLAIPPRTVPAVGLSVTVLGLIVAFVTKPLPFDPMIYLESALDLDASTPTHWSTRIGLVLPTALIASIFGRAEVSVYVVPAFFTLLLALSTYAITMELFRSRLAAFGSGIAVVANPFVLPYATQLLPDIGGAAMITWAVFFVLRSRRSARPDLDLLLAGFLFGIAYLIRETSLLAAPAIALGLAILGRASRLWLPVVSAALVAGVEMLVGQIVWHDPLARLNAVVGRSTDAIVTAEGLARARAVRQRQGGFVRGVALFLDLVLSRSYGWVMTLLSAAGVIAATVRRRRLGLFLLAWLLVPWATLALSGLMRVDSGLQVIRLTLDRYWVAVLVPMVVAAFGSIVELSNLIREAGWQKWLRRGALAVLAIGLVGAGTIESLQERSSWFSHWSDGEAWDLRIALGQVGDAELHVPHNILQVTSIFANDPWGQPVFKGTVKDGDAVPEGHRHLLLAHRDGEVGSESPLEEALANPFPRYHPEIVEDDAAWVLLQPGSGEFIDAGSWGPSEWQYRFTDGKRWSAARRLIEDGVRLDQARDVVLFDVSGRYRAVPKSPPVPGSHRLFVVEMTVPSLAESSVRVICNFYDLAGERYQATAWRTVSEAPEGTWYCLSPSGQPHRMRPVVVLKDMHEVTPLKMAVTAWPVKVVGSH